jgi:tRNA-specific 2-thiouridylase
MSNSLSNNANPGCAPASVPDADRIRAAEYQVQKAERPEKVVVALSGGVDSAVAAWLLKEAGHEVLGVSLRLAPEGDGARPRQGRCCSADDLTDARRLCDALDIPFYAIDARERFRQAVFQPFVDAYRSGQTPIPCLACNHEVKFGDLHATAKKMGARLATGHYAGLARRGGAQTLVRPRDRARDQTYFLYGTPPEALEDLRLPLSGLDKPLVRALAQRAGIPVFSKPDSQEICFVPDGDHGRVVEAAGGPMPAGDLVHIGGKKLGRHDGIHRYTIGQRKGLGGGHGERLFVVDLSPDEAQVVVGPREALMCTRLRAGPLHAIVPTKAWPAEVEVQIRARHRAASARVHFADGGLFEVEFSQPVEAVAPGQAAVIYDGDVLLGGGIIQGRVDGSRPQKVSTLAAG